jgi:hypothetical protein
LRWAWLATTEAYTAEFVAASHTIMIIDGIPYSGFDDLWGPVHYDDEEGAYASSWIYPLPALSAGKHTIEATVSLDHALTDGFDGDNDGNPDEYGPGDAVNGWLEFNLPQAMPANPAACPNGAPQGTWELILEKASSWDGAITIDGIAWQVFNGKNIIFLSSGEVHRIEFDGNTVELTAPECGENTFDVP